MTKSEILADHINNLIASKTFIIANEIDGNYQNMGANIIDGILQAGMSYAAVVKPRVNNYLINYPDIKTTSQFKKLCDKVTIPRLINWKASAKTERIEALTVFLINNNVETQDEFKLWLDNQENLKQLKRLSGIKSKTADYFKILTGHQTNAIDRHLLGFLSNADISVINYKDAQAVISDAAKILNINESFLDYSIWKYMSESKV